MIYFIQCICCSIQAPSVLQVANFVGALKSAGPSLWGSGKSQVRRPPPSPVQATALPSSSRWAPQLTEGLPRFASALEQASPPSAVCVCSSCLFFNSIL